VLDVTLEFCLAPDGTGKDVFDIDRKLVFLRRDELNIDVSVQAGLSMIFISRGARRSFRAPAQAERERTNQRSHQ
jgi:hypothetical protein